MVPNVELLKARQFLYKETSWKLQNTLCILGFQINDLQIVGKTEPAGCDLQTYLEYSRTKWLILVMTFSMYVGMSKAETQKESHILTHILIYMLIYKVIQYFKTLYILLLVLIGHGCIIIWGSNYYSKIHKKETIHFILR